MKRIGCFFLVIFFSLSLASAATQLNIYLDERGDALFLGTTNNGVILPDGINITNGNVLGYTSVLTTKSGDVWTFEYASPSTGMKVFLPKGSSVLHVEGNGTEITLEKEQIVVYAQNNITVSYSVVQSSTETSQTTSIILGIAGIVIATLLIVYIINFNNPEKTVKKPVKKQKKEIDKLALVSNVLNDRENAILAKLKETGKVKSSYLRRMVEIPKASFSRHIRELERKKLVRLSGEGRNKFVELA